MEDMKQVYDFAVKWCDKFRNQKINYIELVDHYMADDCDALGFKMDCGNAFEQLYGKAAHDYEELDKIIDNVTDISLLGSAIYSRWRYFNHWAYTGEEILEFKNRSWFILALSRLSMLTGENPFIFKGIPQKIRIVSNGMGCIVSRKYKVEGGVEGLLDDLDADCLFDNVEGNPPDIIDTPNETKEYTITIDFNKNLQRVIQGTFDKNGLPDDFADFAETVFSFMRFYGFGEILDPSVYEKVKRCKNDYIFCSVTFDEGYKSYYYITDDDSIEVGDSVLVPAGKDNHTAIVEIVNIEYFSEEEVPLPVGKTKRIIRKCTEDDFDQQKEV